MPDPTNRLTARAYLRGIGVVFQREFRAFFDTPIAYVYASAFLLLSCAIFMNSFFLEGVLQMGSYFDVLPYLLIAFAPAMTMRIWAEEHALHTFELLMTFPMHAGQIVLGKFFAALSFYIIVLCGTLPIPCMLLWLGNPDMGLILTNYIGALCLGAFFLAFGMFASALTRDQVVAFVVSAVISAIFVLTAREEVVEIIDGLAPNMQIGTGIYDVVSVGPHLAQFGKGVINLSAGLYFALMAGLFLSLNRFSLVSSRF